MAQMHMNSLTSLLQDIGLATEEEFRKYTHPRAKIATINAASQTRVKVCNPIRSTHWFILVYFTTTVNIAASRQIPVGHGQRRSGRKEESHQQHALKMNLGGEFLIASNLSRRYHHHQSYGLTK